MTFKTVRIIILLLILAFISMDTLLRNSRATDWDHPLRIVIYPINGDGSTQTDQYISQLNLAQFDSIHASIKKEAARYQINLSNPININLSTQVKSLPPELPEDRNIFNVMLWSLHLRYWSWQEDNYQGIRPHIRAYALFYNPKTHQKLAHSTGLEKGKIAIIQLFASRKYSQQNNVIIFHELLHTIGATDKYDLQNNRPVYPDGYAEPALNPRYPQRKAEIMGGRVAVSETEARIPRRLSETVIGTQTAKEIGWVE